MKKVMIFGIFDGIHKGHREFFREAKAYGDYLIAVVAQDHVVEHIYGRLPKINLADRFAHLEREDEVNEIVIGETVPSIKELVKRHRPDSIVLSTLQELIEGDLELHRKEIKQPFSVHIIEGHETLNHPL